MKIAAFIRNIFKKYENRVSVRRAREEDVEEIMGIERKVWPEEEMRATKEMFLSRIRTFPEGFMCNEKWQNLRFCLFRDNTLQRYKKERL